MEMFGNWGDADLHDRVRQVIENELRLSTNVVDSAAQIDAAVERIKREDREFDGNSLYHLFEELSTRIIGNPIPVGNGTAYLLGSQIMQDPENPDQEIRVYSPVYVHLPSERARVFPFNTDTDHWYLSQRDAMIDLLEQVRMDLKHQREGFNNEEGRVLVFSENSND